MQGYFMLLCCNSYVIYPKTQILRRLKSYKCSFRVEDGNYRADSWARMSKNNIGCRAGSVHSKDNGKFGYGGV